MELVRSWFLSVCCAALVAAVAEALSPDGFPRKMARLSGGLLLLLAVLAPIRTLEEADLQGSLERYRQSYAGYVQRAREESETQMKSIIAEQTAAYISDKAATLGITNCRVTVLCAMTAEGFPTPAEVTVWGEGKEADWERLREAIRTDFAIDSAHMRFERTDVP